MDDFVKLANDNKAAIRSLRSNTLNQIYCYNLSIEAFHRVSKHDVIPNYFIGFRLCTIR